MPGRNRGAKSITLTAAVPAIAVGATASTPVGVAPVRGTIISVRCYATALMTGTVAPNFRHIEVFNRGQAGAGVVAVCPVVNFNVGTDLPANAPREFAVTAANAGVLPGDVIDWVSTFDGTGLIDPGGIVEVEIMPSLS